LRIQVFFSWSTYSFQICICGAAAGTGILSFPEEIMQAVLDTEIPEKHRVVSRAAFESALEWVSGPPERNRLYIQVIIFK
jgi:hypothetical protein